VCLNEAEAVRAPTHLTAEEAATLPVAAVTAWHSLYEIGTLRPGEVVLVQGAGGVSVAALQFARAGGARVIGWTRDERHAARLRELGASEMLVTGDPADWPQRVRSLTAGRGVDVVVNVAGGLTLTESIAATRVGGHVHLVGYATDTVANIDIFEAIRHATTIHVATAGHCRSFEDMVRAMDLHAIRPPIGRSYPLTQLADAFNELAQGGRFGKIVLTF
jgi:NADPH:quinone reductase-like Zn-dependent oxidoreductase